MCAYGVTADVPVGEDQRQHLELTRDVGQAFNRFVDSSIFTIPEAVYVKGMVLHPDSWIVVGSRPSWPPPPTVLLLRSGSSHEFTRWFEENE